MQRPYSYMRCKFCFQAIPDHSKQCPQCGSRLAAEVSPAGKGGFSLGQLGEKLPLSGRQAMAVVGGLVLLVVCGCLGLLVLVSPTSLPQPVLAILPFLHTPTPLPTAQVTPITFASPTPFVWQTYRNQQGNFSVDFPAGWLVINQAESGWQDNVRDLAESYSWAETLFETGSSFALPQTRGVDPAGVDLANKQITVFTVGETDVFSRTVNFAVLETAANEQPETLARLAGTLIANQEAGFDFTGQRSERIAIGEREALHVEFIADTTILSQALRVRVNLYFIPVGNRLFLLTYFADEITALNNREVFEQVVQSWRISR